MVVMDRKDGCSTMVGYVILGGLFLVAIACFIHHEIRMRHVDVDNGISTYHMELSECQSPIERKLFKALWANGYEVKTQYPVWFYQLDFAIPELRICIEADGREFHTSKERKVQDRKRDLFLQREGWTTIRFTGTQIHNNAFQCVKKVEEVVNARKTHSG